MVYGAPPNEPIAETNNQALKPSNEPSIVYLTSDSPHTLDVLSPYTTYIIGGLVDKNRHKGICYKRAMTRDIPTAKLPIGEYMTMQSRSVLATNHVAEIILRWLEYGDWAKAFLQVIPKRKEARLKVRKGTSGDQQDKEDGNASSGSHGD
jgi:tRNA (guanine9-N1)-methyltransferase